MKPQDIEQAIEAKVRELVPLSKTKDGLIYASLSCEVTIQGYADTQKTGIKWRAYIPNSSHECASSEETIQVVKDRKANEIAELRTKAAEMLKKADELEGNQ
jgi:hypothetical protein